MMDINSPNRAVDLEIMKKKLEAMLTKSKEELHFLEVEWLHLRNLALRDEPKSKPELKANLESVETNFDDINRINSQQFNINNTNEFKYTAKPNNKCESESEEDL